MARLNWLKSLKVRKLRIKTKFRLVVIWWLNGGHLVVKWWSFGGQNGKNEQPQDPIETPALRGTLAIFNRQGLVSLMLF